MSAIQKVARVMVLQPGQKLCRGVDGNMNLPDVFYKEDCHGCVGLMEHGFMRTTADLKTAITYSGVQQGKKHRKIFEMRIGAVDRGAVIQHFSQYPGEQECLWSPHRFLEPLGGQRVVGDGARVVGGDQGASVQQSEGRDYRGV
jgi:hypothetical protein